MQIARLIFVLLPLILSLPGHAAELIRKEEAALPNAFSARAITRASGIKQVSPDPDGGPVKSPFKLKVAFEPRGGATVAPEDVRVAYLKKPSVDLLDRVKPGLSAQGIDLANAEVPPGEHAIQVTVKDSEGRVSQSVIRLNVGQ